MTEVGFSVCVDFQILRPRLEGGKKKTNKKKLVARLWLYSLNQRCVRATSGTRADFRRTSDN